MFKKEMIAMLLAGGQGSRLGGSYSKSCKTCRSIWRKIPYYRLSAE